MQYEIHPREAIVENAERDLVEFCIELRRRHNLTLAEEVQLLTRRLSEVSKYLLRYERHGRGDKPSGVR